MNRLSFYESFLCNRNSTLSNSYKTLDIHYSEQDQFQGRVLTQNRSEEKIEYGLVIGLYLIIVFLKFVSS